MNLLLTQPDGSKVGINWDNVGMWLVEDGKMQVRVNWYGFVEVKESLEDIQKMLDEPRMPKHYSVAAPPIDDRRLCHECGNMGVKRDGAEMLNGTWLCKECYAL